VRIAVIAIQPQRITDYGKRLMAIVFLLREDEPRTGWIPRVGKTPAVSPPPRPSLRRRVSARFLTTKPSACPTAHCR
jgi:hypothetical protein